MTIAVNSMRARHEESDIGDNNCGGTVDDNEDEEKEEYLEDPASARCIRPGHSDFM